MLHALKLPKPLSKWEMHRAPRRVHRMCCAHLQGITFPATEQHASESPRDTCLNANSCTYIKPTDLESLEWD